MPADTSSIVSKPAFYDAILILSSLFKTYLPLSTFAMSYLTIVFVIIFSKFFSANGRQKFAIIVSNLFSRSLSPSTAKSSSSKVRTATVTDQLKINK